MSGWMCESSHNGKLDCVFLIRWHTVSFRKKCSAGGGGGGGGGGRAHGSHDSSPGTEPESRRSWIQIPV